MFDPNEKQPWLTEAGLKLQSVSIWEIPDPELIEIGDTSSAQQNVN